MSQAVQLPAHPTGAGGTIAAAGIVRNEFLTFALGPEAYGIEILKVQEIRGYNAVTTIPNSPAFLKGVINLRGAIVPIIDLRIKLNFPNVEYTRFTVVIILNLTGRVVGIVVDSVSDVITLQPDEIKPAPDFASSFDTGYILGLATVEDRTLILMDIERMVGAEDMGIVDKAVQ
jgi:purine-binding chemotaxis protein CheW